MIAQQPHKAGHAGVMSQNTPESTSQDQMPGAAMREPSPEEDSDLSMSEREELEDEVNVEAQEGQ